MCFGLQHCEALEQAGKIRRNGLNAMIPMQLVLELLLLKDQVPDVLEVNHLVQVRFFSFSAPDRRICSPSSDEYASCCCIAWCV